MTTKYHINNHGYINECRAKEKCRFGGASGLDNHYSSINKARQAYEEKNNSDVFAVSNKNPDKSHLPKIKKALATFRKDLKARKNPGVNTLSDTIRGGFTQMDIDKVSSNYPMLGESTISFRPFSYGNTPVAVIDFKLDKSQQEQLKNIYNNLESGNISSDSVSVVEKDGCTTFTINAGVRDRLDKRVASKAKIKSSAGKAQVSLDKREIFSISSDDKVMSEALKQMKEAHDFGALRMSDPDETSSFTHLYDDRDLSREDKEEQIKRDVIRGELLRRAKPIENELQKISQPGSEIELSPVIVSSMKDLSEVEYMVDFKPTNFEDVSILPNNRVVGIYNEKQIRSMLSGDYDAVIQRSKLASQ